VADAFNGQFDDHPRFLLLQTLAGIDGINADIAAVDEQIEAHLAPFATTATRLDEIPGIGAAAAAAIIAEIGVDMPRFPTAAHLCSWANFSPGLNNSAGKTKANRSTGHGKPLPGPHPRRGRGRRRHRHLPGRTLSTHPKRRGKPRAIVAVGRSILVIVWHLLADWWPEINAFVQTAITDVRTEGYNRLVKQVKRVGCGFRNREHSARRIRFHCTRKQRAATQTSS
jgi:transposase